MLVLFPGFCSWFNLRRPPTLGLDTIFQKTFVFVQLASNQATRYPEVRLLTALLEEEIGNHRKASANDGSQQCAAYTDDCGENRDVH